MKANLTHHESTNRFEFRVDFEGKIYQAIIHTNSKGKFIDMEVFLNNREVSGETFDKIIAFIDNNWDLLTN